MECQEDSKKGVLRYYTVLSDLKNFGFTERANATLLCLNHIVKTNPEGIFHFYMTGGFDLVIKLMQYNNNLTSICLKILANASQKNINIRKGLARSNIFYFLSSKLGSKEPFRNIILYSALVVILVHGNHEAQNQMRVSGCLSNITKILSFILDDGKNTVPYRCIEVIVYALMVCVKNPRNYENQTDVGWIIPKILNYIDKPILFLDGEELQLEKAFWSFLKSALDENEKNQQIFVDHFGLAIMLKSMQEIFEEKKTEEMSMLLVKMTGLLVKINYHKGFLWQAYNYCAIMILCSILETSNGLVNQRIITFLNTLTSEIPQALNIINDQEIFKEMSENKIISLRRKTAMFRQNIWEGTQPSADLELLQDLQSFTPILKDDNFQYNLCILHDCTSYGKDQISSEASDISIGPIEKDRNLHQLRQSNIHFNKQKFRERKKKIAKKIRQHLCLIAKENKKNVVLLMIKSVSWMFQKVFYFVASCLINGKGKNVQNKIKPQKYQI